MYVWMAPIHFDTAICLDAFGGHPNIWVHPNRQGVSRNLGASKHINCPNIQEASKHTDGHPNMGVSKYMGVSNHMGGVQTYGASKCTRGASKHMGACKHKGDVQTYWGHPNIQGSPNVWGHMDTPLF